MISVQLQIQKHTENSTPKKAHIVGGVLVDKGWPSDSGAVVAHSCPETIRLVIRWPLCTSIVVQRAGCNNAAAAATVVSSLLQLDSGVDLV